MKQQFRRKKSKVLVLEQLWVLGLNERGSKRFFLKVVNNRSALEIIPEIVRHINPASIIYTDSYSVYVNPWTKQSKLAQYNFVHLFINHGLTFTHSVLREIQTNTIKNF